MSIIPMMRSSPLSSMASSSATIRSATSASNEAATAQQATKATRNSIYIRAITLLRGLDPGRNVPTHYRQLEGHFDWDGCSVAVKSVMDEWWLYYSRVSIFIVAASNGDIKADHSITCSYNWFSGMCQQRSVRIEQAFRFRLHLNPFLGLEVTLSDSHTLWLFILLTLQLHFSFHMRFWCLNLDLVKPTELYYLGII